MEQKSILLNNRREDVFFFSLILAAGVFPFSEALVSIVAGLLLFQAVVLRSWLHPSVNKRRRITVLFPVSIFIIYLAGTFFTHDFDFALYELKKVVFWIVIPMAVFLSPRLTENRVYTVLLVFVVSVTVSSLIFTAKLILHDVFEFSDFRSISIISHIRFSFQVILALIVIAWTYFKRRKFNRKIYPVYLVILFFWLTLFLFMLKSLLGIIAFLSTLTLFLIVAAVKIKDFRMKLFFAFAFLFIFLLPVYLTVTVIIDFYDFKNVEPAQVDYITASGNQYSHDFNEQARENGHLVYIYIAEDELRHEWNKQSEIKYDDELNGYPLGSTLIRYLASRGYRKDSVGISRLTPDEIRLIEEGVTNYKFKNRIFSIYPRIYETVWEIDFYLRTGDPNNKSLAQRIEFAKASIFLIKENPWFGIGTGNWVLKYNEAYDKMESRLAYDKRAPSHNQYLNYMVKFGITGFILIVIAILTPVFYEGHLRNFIFILFLIAMAVGNLGDANLETHMGLSFFTFFYSLLLWNSTNEMKKSIF
jgi:hypothetical protein